jgi:FxsC-like protein
VEVAAPTTQTVPAGGDPHRYGKNSTDWRPFPEQELALAEYARQVAERFDFEVRVSEIKSQPSKPEVSDDVGIPRLGKRKPGILLIDPWFVADGDGERGLKSAVEHLPRWVLPLVASDQPDDKRTAELVERVRTMLNAAGALPTESSRRASRGVGSLDAFVATVRELVAEAERQYLRYSSGPPGPGRSKRPRLGGAGWPTAPKSAGRGRDE